MDKYLKTGKKKSHIDKEQSVSVKPLTALKAELQSLEFEKSLVSEAITRVYEGMQRGYINTIEYDRLLLKYKQQLDYYTEKITELRSTSNFVKIQDIRNDLVYFLEKRIKEIDEKLVQLSKESNSLTLDTSVDNQTPLENNKNQGQRWMEKNSHSKDTLVPMGEGRHIQEMQGEIMQALSRLEQIKINNENLDSKPPINKKRGALASLQ